MAEEPAGRRTTRRSAAACWRRCARHRPGRWPSRSRRSQTGAPLPRIAAVLRLRLGREHGAGRAEVGAARPDGRPAHPQRAGRRDPRRRRRGDASSATPNARSARRCWRSCRRSTKPSTRGCSGPELAASATTLLEPASRHDPTAHHRPPHQETAAAARRRRRPGRLGQDDAGRDAVQDDARPLRPGRRHQRHLHQGRPAPADGGRRAVGRSHHGRGDRRLPAHRDPRRRVDQPRSGRPHAGEISRTPTSCSSSRAATTWPPPSAPS